MEITCGRCKNCWDYKGKNIYYATCTHCLTKVKVPKDNKQEVKDNDMEEERTERGTRHYD